MRRPAAVLAALLACACADAPAQKPPADDPAIARIGRNTDNLALGPCHGERGNLCYDDADGVSQFWVKNFPRRIHSAEVRSRQERYNLWMRGVHFPPGFLVTVVEAPLTYRYYRPPLRPLSAGYLVLPKSIRATGALDWDTVAIPYYRSAYRLLAAQRRFAADCERDYAADYESRALCGTIVSGARETGREAAAELQRFPEEFRLRVAALRRAFERSRRLAQATEAVLGSSGKYPEELIMDGVNPDELAPDKLAAMEEADVLLATSLDEVDWAEERYQPRGKP